MAYRKIVDNVYEVGIIDWDRQLFDDLIPLHRGTSYNSYLIIGNEKIALIDAVDPKFSEEFINNIKSLNIKKIDYIISNHAEQDHSGAIPQVLKYFPDSKIITNSKCKDFLKDLLLLKNENFITIQDKQTISLGNYTLEFILFPWVHWPETMLTYLKEENILFTCDLFGSHIADNQLYYNDEKEIYEGAIRYYAEIMSPFRNIIKNNMNKIIELSPKIIAPSHGYIHKNPEIIINLYNEWVSEKYTNKVIILYVSMHHSTEFAAKYISEKLTINGIKVCLHNLTYLDTGQLAIDLINAPTVILATPALLGGIHPKAAFAAYLLNILRPGVKFLSIVCSYGWGSKMKEHILSLISNLKVEFLNEVIFKGFPKDNDLLSIDSLITQIVDNHKKLNLI